MLTYKETPDSKFIELTVEGKITTDDINKVIADLEPRFNEWDSINLLKEIKDFNGIEAEGFWSDLKFLSRQLKNFKNIRRYAIVSDKKWIETAAKLSDVLFKGEVKHFERENIEHARKWATAVA